MAVINGKYTVDELLSFLDQATKIKQEGTNYDFKREWPKNLDNNVLAMLNIIQNDEDAFIFIGIEEDKINHTFNTVGVIESQLKDNNFFNNLSLNERANINICTIKKDNLYIQVICITNRYNKPYFKINGSGQMLEKIFIRNNSATVSATPEEIEELYKYRFKMEENYLSKFARYSANIDNWSTQHSFSSEVKLHSYYIPNPVYRIMVNSISKNQLLYTVNLVYMGTVICESLLFIEYIGNGESSAFAPKFLKEGQNKKDSIYYNIFLILNSVHDSFKKLTLLDKKNRVNETCRQNNIDWV